MRTSYSALDTFRTCQLKYKFQEIDKVKAPKSKEAVFGTIIHSTLKFMHEPRPISPTIEEVLEFYNGIWNSDIYQDKQEETAILSEGVRILENYYKKNNPKKFSVIDLETRFSLDLEDVTLSGIIDRIDKLEDDSFEIIDYKTAKSLPSQQDVDKNFQLSVYHMAVNDRWPNFSKPIKLSLYYLKHGIKLSTIRTPDQIKETRQYILDIIKDIQKANFAPTPGPLCDWCGYQNQCPMWKHKFKTEEKSAIDIKAVLLEFYKAKSEDKKNAERIAQLQKTINEYCDANGLERVFGEGIYVTRVLQKRFGYDPEKVRQILEPLGKWDEVIAIDSAKLKKVLSSLDYKNKRQIEEAREIKKEFKTLNLKEGKK